MTDCLIMRLSTILTRHAKISISDTHIMMGLNDNNCQTNDTKIIILKFNLFSILACFHPLEKNLYQIFAKLSNFLLYSIYTARCCLLSDENICVYHHREMERRSKKKNRFRTFFSTPSMVFSYSCHKRFCIRWLIGI
jgi:hypothetical protein